MSDFSSPHQPASRCFRSTCGFESRILGACFRSGDSGLVFSRRVAHISSGLNPSNLSLMALNTSDERGSWGSRLGFILAAAGSAVGLGNIWRFSYVTGENGGAAFVFLYLVCVFFIGFPLMMNELMLGRVSKKNPIGAFRVTQPGTPFILTGILCVVLCFVVLSYYGVIAGWAIGYALSSISHDLVDTQSGFAAYAENSTYAITFLGLFMLATVLIVRAGVEKGIERWVKVLMPFLFIIIGVIIVRSLTLEGAGKGVAYYLKPDFGKIFDNPRIVIAALGQAFFSLSVGWGLMITYGSYMKKTQSIPGGAFWVCLMDTTVALLGGLMIFPAVFAFGLKPNAGSGLAFETLPKVFEQMQGGPVIAVLFFVLLTIAALTSSISMLEVPVSFLLDNKKTSRSVAAFGVGTLAFLAGIPSALSQGGSEFFTNMEFNGKKGFLDIMDNVFGTILVIVVSLLCSVYVGWIWKTSKAVDELQEGAPGFTGLAVRIWTGIIRFVAPIVIVIVLLFQFIPEKKEDEAEPESGAIPAVEQVVEPS